MLLEPRFFLQLSKDGLCIANWSSRWRSLPDSIIARQDNLDLTRSRLDSAPREYPSARKTLMMSFFDVDDASDAPPWEADPELAARVNAQMRKFQQGYVVKLGLMTWLADREHPLTRQTAEGGGKGAGITKAKPEHEFMAVVTQTCDLFKPCAATEADSEAWPFVQLCPVVKLIKSAVRGEAAGGHIPRFAPLPALGDDYFADLNQCVTVEKTVLLGLDEPVDGCGDDASRILFADVVAR